MCVCVCVRVCVCVHVFVCALLAMEVVPKGSRRSMDASYIRRISSLETARTISRHKHTDVNLYVRQPTSTQYWG